MRFLVFIFMFVYVTNAYANPSKRICPDVSVGSHHSIKAESIIRAIASTSDTISCLRKSFNYVAAKYDREFGNIEGIDNGCKKLDDLFTKLTKNITDSRQILNIRNDVSAIRKLMCPTK